MPYPNEHSCRVRDPEAFQPDSFRRMSREHEGKKYYVIVGRLEGETSTSEQAYRYPKSTWSVTEARSHCSAHDGIKFEPASEDEESNAVSVADKQQRCAGQHFGMWTIEPHWFMEAVSAVQAGTMPRIDAAKVGESLQYERDDTGLALIPLHDFMTKYGSSYGGVSTLRLRQTIRRAATDDTVKAILLHIDSPGGTVAGTAELAADVAKADSVKPTYAYLEDLGASAAYWVASQARRLGANATAQIGSIGTLAIVEDTSGKAEQEGVKVHVLSTGAYKGAFVDGAEVLPAHLTDLQNRVDELNEHFLAGVQKGRGMPIADVRKLADGRTYIASKALAAGLIDVVQPLDDFVGAIRKEIKAMGTQRRDHASRMLRLAEQS